MNFIKTISFLIALSLSHIAMSLNLTVDSTETDSMVFLFEKGIKKVNHCTPWHHVQCVAITGTEVFEDGRDGKKGRHWWRMSYIGQACKDRYGKVFGTIFEIVWIVPHYTGVVIGSGFGWMMYAVRGPRDPEKVARRQEKKQQRKDKRVEKKTEKEK